MSPTVFRSGKYRGFLSRRELERMQRVVEEHHVELVRAWRKHFA